jgi:LemA protein
MATIALIAIIAALIAVMMMYNKLVSLRNQVDNGWKQIDVQLKRRHDLIPNLVETVKGAMQFERDTLERVMQARSRAVGATSMGERTAAENEVTQSLGRLFAVMENYPTLKANQNVLQLQEELTTTENQLAFARQFYNDVVMQLNTREQLFPGSLVATFFTFKPAEYFTVAADEQATPRVDLSLSR